MSSLKERARRRFRRRILLLTFPPAVYYRRPGSRRWHPAGALPELGTERERGAAPEVVDRRTAVAALDADPVGWGIDLSGSDTAWQVKMSLSWALAGWSAEESMRWREAGLWDPARAQRWVDAGGTPDDVRVFRGAERLRFTVDAQVPRETVWADLYADCQPGFAGLGYRQGQTPQAVQALARALRANPNRHAGADEDATLTPPPGAFPWKGWRDAARAERFAATLTGLDWADVATCVSVGIDWVAAADHVCSGQEMGPIRLTAALAS